MSEVSPLLDGWVGYGDGASIQVETGTPIDSEHPVVKERPELFTAPPADEPPVDEMPAEASQAEAPPVGAPRKAARPKPPNG